MAQVYAEPRVQTDIYAAARAGLRERLEVLAGRGGWCEPIGGHGTRTDSVPYEHTLAAALAFARDRADPDDVGPDVLESMVYRRALNGARIVDAMVRALADMSARLAAVDRRVLRCACVAVLAECVTGCEARRPRGVPEAAWMASAALGGRLLFAAAGQTLRRLREVLGASDSGA